MASKVFSFANIVTFVWFVSTVKMIQTGVQSGMLHPKVANLGLLFTVRAVAINP